MSPQVLPDARSDHDGVLLPSISHAVESGSGSAAMLRTPYPRGGHS